MNIKWRNVPVILSALVTTGAMWACNGHQQGAHDQRSAGPTANTSLGASEGTSAVTIQYSSQPDPPRTGDDSIEIIVLNRDGTPVNDADVSAVFSMPPMPSMNMPAMRSIARLAPQRPGHYAGVGRFSMAGTWNVSITVTRADEQVGGRAFSITVK